jgi:PAS domain S-box-containing protein
LHLLHDVALATAAVLDVDDLLQQVVRLVVSRLPYDHFGFLLADNSTELLYPHPSFTGLPPSSLDIAVPFCDCVAGEAINRSAGVIIDELAGQPACHAVMPDARSLVAVPVHLQGELLGLVVALSAEPHRFDDSDITFLTTLGSHLAGAIARTQLVAGLHRNALQLSDQLEAQQERLAAGESRLAAILDHAGEAIVFASPTGVLLYVNQAGLDLVGEQADTALGQALVDFLGPDVLPATAEQLSLALRGGDKWSGEVEGRRRDGRSYHVHLTLAPLRDAEGLLEGFVSVLADISHLHEVERLKAELVTTLSHELRTPLATLKTYVRLLGCGKPERQHTYLQILDTEVTRLGDLVQDLMAIAQVEVGQMAARPIALPPLIDEVFDHFYSQAARRQVTLERQMETPLPHALGDERQLYRALANLVDNALAFTPPGGRVRVAAGSASREGRSMGWLRVEDTGPGLAAEELACAFERLHRGRTAPSSGSTATGAGLALAVAREIARRHQGALEVESGPDAGAAFTLWLPLAA